MLYLANKTDKTYDKNLDDFLQSPMGADSGKCFAVNKWTHTQYTANDVVREYVFFTQTISRANSSTCAFGFN